MAGASIPLTPMVHQMIDIGPVPRFADTTRLIEYPIVRDMDTNMYERQEGTGLEIGSYAHRPITARRRRDPVDRGVGAHARPSCRSRRHDFDPQMEQALELMPEIVGDESVGVKYAINGVLSVTYDGMPLLGETPEVRGPVVGGGDLDQGGPGRRQDGRRADGPRRVRDRRLRVQHRPRLPAAAAHARPHPRPRRRGLQQDVRDRPPRRAVGVGPRRAAVARSTSASASSAPSSTRPPAGSARTGTSRTRALLEEYGDRDHPPRGRVGGALVVADHQRRAPGDARPRGDDRPDRVRDLRHHRARARSTSSSGVAMRQMDVADRPRRLHAAADPERRLQART